MPPSDRAPAPGPAPAPGRTAARRRATTWPARAAAGLLGGVVVFQSAVALGAPWGAWTQGGGTSGRLGPRGRAVAGVSGVLLAVMAAALLARAGEGPLAGAPRRVVDVLAWGTVAYLGVGLPANLATPSARERALWAPVVAVLLVLALVAVVSSRRGVSGAAAAATAATAA